MWRLLAAVLVLLLVGCNDKGDEDRAGPSDRRPAPAGQRDERRGEPVSASELAAAKSFKRHRLYYLGDSFAGLDLTSVNVTEAESSAGPAVVDFIYGDCDPGGGPFEEGGCSPPIDVQIWSVCDRFPAGSDAPFRRTWRRGVPTGDFGDRLELYTGDATVVVFGTKRRVERAVSELRALDGRIGAEEDLPRPLPGVVTGRPRGCPLPLAEARAQEDRRLFYVGPSFEGLELADVLGLPSSTRGGPPPGGGMVIFNYRRCSGAWGALHRCRPPIQLMVSRFCVPSASVHGSPRLPQSRLRGVPATTSRMQSPLRLTTGNATVSIAMASFARAARAARALRSVDGEIGPGEDLPPPNASRCPRPKPPGPPGTTPPPSLGP